MNNECPLLKYLIIRYAKGLDLKDNDDLDEFCARVSDDRIAIQDIAEDIPLKPNEFYVRLDAIITSYLD